jgi:hypothetical protein
MRPICAGAKSAKAHRSDSFVKRRENLRFLDPELWQIVQDKLPQACRV